MRQRRFPPGQETLAGQLGGEPRARTSTSFQSSPSGGRSRSNATPASLASSACRVAKRSPASFASVALTSRPTAARSWVSSNLERRDRPRPHAAAGGDIERLVGDALQGGEAQGINRRLEHGNTTERRSGGTDAKQRLVAAAQRTFVGRAPDLDMGHRALAPVREPSAALRTAADRVLA